MKNYEVEYSYGVRKFGDFILQADSVEDAENVALQKLDMQLPDDVEDIEIETIRELR